MSDLAHSMLKSRSAGLVLAAMLALPTVARAWMGPPDEERGTAAAIAPALPTGEEAADPRAPHLQRKAKPRRPGRRAIAWVQDADVDGDRLLWPVESTM